MKVTGQCTKIAEEEEIGVGDQPCALSIQREDVEFNTYEGHGSIPGNSRPRPTSYDPHRIRLAIAPCSSGIAFKRVDIPHRFNWL